MLDFLSWILQLSLETILMWIVVVFGLKIFKKNYFFKKSLYFTLAIKAIQLIASYIPPYATTVRDIGFSLLQSLELMYVSGLALYTALELPLILVVAPFLMYWILKLKGVDLVKMLGYFIIVYFIVIFSFRLFLLAVMA